MRGSHTLLFIGLGGVLLFAFAMKRGGGASSSSGRPATPGRAATAPAPATPKPKPIDPVKSLTETAKKEATAAGQQVIRDWFRGQTSAP